MIKVFYAGDSTVQYNDFHTYPQIGIGQVIGTYLRNDIEVVNYAKNGRSTRSFINEGRLNRIEREMSKGDFLFVQFGHNDEKADEERHTDPYTTFQENLKKFVEVAHKEEGYIVLITPIYRRHFDENGKTKDFVHMDYPDALIDFAKRENVPYIDLCQMSREYLDCAGDDNSKTLYMNFGPGIYKNYPDGLEDNTHLRYHGAAIYSSMIAKGLKNMGGVYENLLNEKETDD